MSDDRWSRTAARLGELEERRRDAFTEAVRGFVQPRGDEHALDLGTGTGALAFALAPYVADVLAVDRSPALLEEGRRRGSAFPNVTFVEGDATQLDVRRGTFDLGGCSRVLHHVPRPEMIVAVARSSDPVRRAGGRDRPDRPGRSAGRRRARPLRARAQPGAPAASPRHDVRALLEANGLVVVRTRSTEEQRDLAWYLDLADCEGEERERAAELAPPSPTANVGWYLAFKPQPGT